MKNRTRPAVRPAEHHTGRTRRSPWIQTLASVMTASALLLLLPAMPAGADGAGGTAVPAALADLPQAPTDGEAAILAYVNEAPQGRRPGAGNLGSGPQSGGPGTRPGHD
ncbi:MAG: hypothetical protein ACM3ZA_02070 [Bacillota bacterium]